MVKTTTTLTLDVDVLARAKARFGNLSGYVNDVLKTAVGLDEVREGSKKIPELEQEIAEKTAEAAQLHQLLAKEKKKKQKSAKNSGEKGRHETTITYLGDGKQ